jgi:hypothetical protein
MTKSNKHVCQTLRQRCKAGTDRHEVESACGLHAEVIASDAPKPREARIQNVRRSDTPPQISTGNGVGIWSAVLLSEVVS